MTRQQAADEAERTVERAEENPVVQVVARGGFVASGVVQGLIGVVAIEVGLHRAGSAPDETGALHDIAHAPGGPVVLWTAAGGALALGLWLVVAGVIARHTDGRVAWTRRLREWGRAIVFLLVGVEAVRVALGIPASSATTSRKGSAGLLAVPGGVVLLALIGLGIVVGGGIAIWLGLAKRFERTVRVPHSGFGVAFVLLGRVGYTARGLAIAIVGVLVVVAAITLDPKKASGLDGALRSLTALPFGEPILVLIGVGWIAAGLFTIARARQAILDA